MLPLRLLWLPWVLSTAERCKLNYTSYTGSTALESLQCYNDYQSYFHCMWREEPESRSNQTLTLWLNAKNSRKGLCEDYPSDEQGLRQCRYKTKVFGLGTTYTAFFNESVCFTAHKTYLDLSTLLRARTPVSLTTFSSGDGGTLITWSSPYPQSSALNNNITYEVSYKPNGHNNWTEEKLWDNHKKLEKKSLSPGHGYKARVRARVTLGQWSHWSPTVSWYTQPDVETVPPVDCVLWGDQEVQCRWEQSSELVHFISYQLVCRQNQTAPLEKCCEEPAFSSVHRGYTVKFSCILRLTQPPTSSLQVALEPMRSIKTFNSTEHIHPYPPTHVKVTETGQNWIVEWTPPNMRISQLDYEVCYYSQEKGLENMCNDFQLVDDISTDMKIIHIPMGSTSVTITGLSLLPSHRYRVKVRTRVMSPYEGTPSDWSTPVEWTSHAAVWPISYWIYMFVAVLVAGVFLTFFIIPACRRKTILWVESVPSPSKSKVILDIQMAINPKVKQLFENTYQCKRQDMDSVSTCSSYVSLWSIQKSHPQQGEQVQQTEGEEEEEEKREVVNESNRSCVNVDHSTKSFTGPYILCQPVESNPDKDILDQTELSCPDVESPTTVRIISFEEGYVRLPSHTMSRSVLDMPSQTHGSTVELSSCSTEEKQHCMNEDHSSDTFWPHGGAIQISGYCQLPTDFTTAPQLGV